MDGVQSFLDELRELGLASGHFLGLLHLLIGRRIARVDGSVVSPGLTWRAVAEELRKARWDKEAVRELHLDPRDLAPRDRQRYWYMAIAQARIESSEAIEAGNALAKLLVQAGFVVSPSPGQKSS